VLSGETVDPSIRPNQIFAVSLPHCMLRADRASEDLVLCCVRHDYVTRILKRTGNLAAVMRTTGHRL
jgi:hypothetical protein